MDFINYLITFQVTVILLSLPHIYLEDHKIWNHKMCAIAFNKDWVNSALCKAIVSTFWQWEETRGCALAWPALAHLPHSITHRHCLVWIIKWTASLSYQVDMSVLVFVCIHRWRWGALPLFIFDFKGYWGPPGHLVMLNASSFEIVWRIFAKFDENGLVNRS